MKILFVTATFPPSANGVAVSVFNLYKEMVRRGHEVVVFAPANGKTKDPVGIVRYPSIPNPFIPDYPLPLFPLTPKIIKILLTTKFDVVHAQHPFYISFFAGLFAFGKNTPFVFTYHTRYGEYVRTYFPWLPVKYIKLIDKYIFSAVFKNADAIVSPSFAIQSYLRAIDLKKRIEVIPSGIPETATPSFFKQKVRKKYEISSKSRVILCVSRLGKEKNLELLLKTLSEKSQIYVLVLVGVGPDKENLQSYANKLGLGKRVIFLGKISYEKMPEVYKMADIFAFASHTETQGLVLLEAQYFGLPVVAVDNPVNKEWVRGGIIAKKGTKSLGKLIDIAYKRRKTLVPNGKKFARQYTISKVADNLLKVYSSIKKS